MKYTVLLIVLLALSHNEQGRWRVLPFGFETTDSTTDDDATRK